MKVIDEKSIDIHYITFIFFQRFSQSHNQNQITKCYHSLLSVCMWRDRMGYLFIWDFSVFWDVEIIPFLDMRFAYSYSLRFEIAKFYSQTMKYGIVKFHSLRNGVHVVIWSYNISLFYSRKWWDSPLPQHKHKLLCYILCCSQQQHLWQ